MRSLPSFTAAAEVLLVTAEVNFENEHSITRGMNSKVATFLTTHSGPLGAASKHSVAFFLAHGWWGGGIINRVRLSASGWRWVIISP